MKKNVKRLTAYLLALMLMLSMCATASASYSVEVVDDGEVTTVEVISKPVDVVYDVRTGILTWRLAYPGNTNGDFSLELVDATVERATPMLSATMTRTVTAHIPSVRTAACMSTQPSVQARPGTSLQAPYTLSR